MDSPIPEPINIDGVDYNYADLSPEALKWLGHLNTTDEQLDNIAVNMEKLKVLRDGCYTRLLASLPKTDEPPPAA